MVLSPSVPLLPPSVCRTASALVSPPSEVVTSVAFRRRRKNHQQQQQEVSGWRWEGDAGLQLGLIVIERGGRGGLV